MAPSAVTTIETSYTYPSHTKFDTAHHLGLHGVSAPKGLVGNALKNRVENIDHETCDAGEEDAFFVADLGDVYRQHMRWKLNLPRVKPFYGKFDHCRP